MHRLPTPRPRNLWLPLGVTVISWMLATSALLAERPSGIVLSSQLRQPLPGTLDGVPAGELTASEPLAADHALSFDDWITPRLPPYPARHVGRGQPLHGTSWLNRPQHAGLFVGSWFGDTLITDQVRKSTGLFSGVRVGRDLGHFWGSELRLSLAYIGAEHLPTGAPLRDCRNVLGDVHVLYYPWGDSAWRPFASVGMGVIGLHFVDHNEQPVDETLFHVPWGVGLKYLWHRSIVVRMDVKDNVAFAGSRLNTMHNWSLTGGIELHWGGDSSLRYFPW